MADSLVIQPEFRAEGQVRRASSDCCGAKLASGDGARSLTCRACGQPCARVLPEKVTDG